MTNFWHFCFQYRLLYVKYFQAGGFGDVCEWTCGECDAIKGHAQYQPWCHQHNDIHACQALNATCQWISSNNTTPLHEVCPCVIKIFFFYFYFIDLKHLWCINYIIYTLLVQYIFIYICSMSWRLLRNNLLYLFFTLFRYQNMGRVVVVAVSNILEQK